LNPAVPLAQEIDQMWMQRKDIYHATSDFEANNDYNGNFADEAKKIWENVIPKTTTIQTPKQKRIIILSSSRGSTFQGLLQKKSEGRIPNAEFVKIITDRKDAGIVAVGKEAKVPTEIVEKGSDLSQEEYERLLINEIKILKPDIIIMAGWMKIMSETFCDNFTNQLFNVHPSLLPAYAGLMDMAVHEEVVKNQEPYSGATVHKVIAKVDKGDIVVQRKIAVDPQDSPEMLKTKIQRQEILAFCDLIEK
jgi:phosphoribosylglycinamide formyltransferase-1